MRIIIDVDGVLRNWVGSLLRCFDRDYGRENRKDVIDDWDIRKFFGIDDIYKYCFGVMHEDILVNAEPFEGAVELTKELCKRNVLTNDRDHEVIISTAQPRNCIIPTVQWLEKRGFRYDHLHFTPASDKTIFRNADFILEDKPKTLDMFKRLRLEDKSFAIPICVSRPYNKNFSGVRINRLEDFMNIISMHETLTRQ